MRKSVLILGLLVAACGRAGAPEVPEAAASLPDQRPAYATTAPQEAGAPPDRPFLLDPLI